MRSLDEYLRDAAKAHGHLCAGQVLGVRLAMLGLQKLGIDDPQGKDRKRLVTFVEIDRCATDAVAVVTGCRLGKRALKFRDWGKVAATFVDVSTGKAIRIAAKESSKELARQLHSEIESKNQQQMLAYREISDEDLFTTQWVKVDLPPEEFPGLLVFLSGLGGFRASNTYQIEELVSHGYVVVGLDQPGGSAAVRFPDGRLVSVLPRDQIQALIQQSTSPKQDAPALNGQVLENGIIPYFAQDASFAIDRLIALNESDPNGRLAGRLDLQRVGVFGISLGAIVAGEASHMDARIKASLMMDAAMPADVVQAGLRQACMWITRPAGDMRLERSRSGGWPEASITETLTTMRAVFDMHAPGSAYYLDAPGMFHVNFTDAPFWSPITSQLGLTGPVDGKRMFDIVNAYSLAFFDKYLKGQREPLLDGPATQFPEVHLERR